MLLCGSKVRIGSASGPLLAETGPNAAFQHPSGFCASPGGRNLGAPTVDVCYWRLSGHRGHAAAQALDRGRAPSTIRSVMVGGLLDLESAQAETAQQKLERSMQGADAAAVLSRTQRNRERRHPSFVAERIIVQCV